MMKFQYASLRDILSDKKYDVEDIKSQYIALLSQLTTAEPVSTELFLKQVNAISEIGNIVIGFCFNIEEQAIQIIGSGTIFFEPKIIHGCKFAGLIEDIVVHQSYRGLGVAQFIIFKLKLQAIDKKCYKVILDCDPNLAGFYEKCGFIQKGVQMAKYF